MEINFLKIWEWLQMNGGVITLVGILVNSLIAVYNVGKNRTIYGVTTEVERGVENVNKKLKKGDYTILHVESTNERGSILYVLGKLKK